MKSILKTSLTLFAVLSFGFAAQAQTEMSGYEKASQYLVASNMYAKTKKHRNIASTKHKKKKKKKKHSSY